MSSPMSLAFYKQKKMLGAEMLGILIYGEKFRNSNLGPFDQLLDLVCPLSNRMGILGVPHGDFGDFRNPNQHFSIS